MGEFWSLYPTSQLKSGIRTWLKTWKQRYWKVENLELTSFHGMDFFLWDDIMYNIYIYNIYIYIYPFLKLPNDPILKGESLVFPKKHLPFFHFDEGWRWMSPLKTSLKKNVDCHHSKLLGVDVYSPPPFWASPHSQKHHGKPSDREAVSFCHGSVLCLWMSKMPLQNHHQRWKKKCLHAQGGISKWSKILLATGASHNLTL